jgi:hypothetical protein
MAAPASGDQAASTPAATDSLLGDAKPDDKAAKKKSSGPSLGQKLTANLNIAKQWTLQKVGKAQATQESESFQQMVKQFQLTKSELQELFDRANHMLQLNTDLVDAEAQFSATVGKLGSHSKSDVKAQEIVQIFCSYTNVLQSYRKKYDDSVNELLVKPLDALLQNEVKKTGALIQRLDSVRLHYDACMTKFKALQESKTAKAQEKKDAEEQTQAATSQYELTKEQLKNLCDVVETRKKALLQEHLPQYIRAQQAFFSESLATVQDRGTKTSAVSHLQDDQKGSEGGKVLEGEF